MTRVSISVVVVNFNGRMHLSACFNSLLKQDYPADLVELILIDNGSHDDSLELMRTHYPTVKVIANERNVGFAPAVNQGAAAASGQCIALLNNDAYADPGWLTGMATMFEAQRDEQVVCVAARMLDWYGRRIDFVGGGINFYGMGNQFFHRLPVDSVPNEAHDVLFACGGAMLVDRELFLDLGGFDADYFAYFEDVDFGWRLWVCGYRVRFAPEAVVYHRSHGTSSSMPGHKVLALYERNALFTIIKNYEEASLNRILAPALMLTMQRALGYAGDAVDWERFRIDAGQTSATDSSEFTVPGMMLSFLAGMQDLFAQLPHLWEKRQQVQVRRQRPDGAIFPLFRNAMWPHYPTAEYTRLQSLLVEIGGIRALFGDTPVHRVLIISTDPLHAHLAGPGIRVVEMARHLAHHCQVVVAAPQAASIRIPEVICVTFEPGDSEALERLAADVEVVIVQGFQLHKYPVLKRTHRVVVVDLYDPFHLENLQLHARYGEDAHLRTSIDQQVVNDLLQAGDFFLCASERQRDFWMGALGSTGRLSPEMYVDDPAFRSLIDVVSFGIDPTPPVRQEPVLKGVLPGIAASDMVVLWGGGIWDWLDPLTVIRAMDLVRQEREDIKLFFLGGATPIPMVSAKW
ncbi:MAG: glycosyltransferase [Chloroflexaceae bacterium]|nr:glycosyltransferase [Chloroflexaceae bacterium]